MANLISRFCTGTRGVRFRAVGLALLVALLPACNSVPQARPDAVADAVPATVPVPVPKDEPEEAEHIELGDIWIKSTDNLWGEAKGILPSRMASDAGAYFTIYRTVWKHPDGDRLVCLHYPGLELFGTPYDLAIFDRDFKVLYQTQTGAPQNDTPYCIALVRLGRPGDLPRNKWAFAFATWGNHYQDIQSGETTLGFLRDGKTREFEDEPFEFLMSALDDTAPFLIVEDTTLEGEIHWIEPGENLFKHAVRDKDDPDTFRLPRAFVEKNLVTWLQSPDDGQVIDALEMIRVGGVRSKDVREPLATVLPGLFSHKRSRVREMAAEALVVIRGRDAASQLATLVQDADQEVRGFATMALLLFQDAEYIDAINTGCAGLAGFDEASVIVWAIERWGHVGLAAGLIHFLEDDEYLLSDVISWWEQIAVDRNYQGVGTAALQARRVLQQLTRVWFPFDKEVAMEAWRKAGHLPDHERSTMLQSLLPKHVQLEFEVKADGTGIHLTVRNPSDRDVWLPQTPTYFQATDDNHNEVEFQTYWEERQNQTFNKLAAGQSMAKTFHRRDGLILNEVAKDKPVRVRVVYSENGKAFGVRAWQGVYESTLTHVPGAE